MPAPSKRSWRKPRGGTHPAPKIDSPAGGTSWQTRSHSSGGRGAVPTWAKLAGLGVAVAILATLLIVFLIFRERKIPVVEVTVTHYDQAIPPNALAWEDVERLQAANPLNVKHLPDEFRGDLTWQAQNKLLDHLAQRLSGERPGGPNGDAIVVYLSAHGAVDDKARPCLLLSDAKPLDDSTWLPLTEVLAAIKDNTPAGARKLLILDTARLDAPWHLGQLSQGFADVLAEAVKQVNVPHLYVLHAAGPGQIAWAAPELAGTVFGQFVADAFDGQADRAANGGNDDGVVSLQEMHRFVRTGVFRWVRTNRADRQQPMLISPDGDAADFPLVSLSRSPQLPARSAPPGAKERIRRRFGEIADLWQQFAHRAERYGLLENDPVSLSELRRALLALEQLALAGQAYDTAFEQALSATRQEIQSVGPQPALDASACSVPLADCLAAEPVDEVRLEQYLRAWRQADGFPQAAEGEPPLPKEDYLTTVQAALAWLADGPMTVERVTEVLRAVDEVRRVEGPDRKAAPDVVEIQLLRLLHRQLAWNDAEQGALASQATGAALATRRLAESAAAPADDRVHYFVQGEVDSADIERRFAEDRLLGDEGPVGKALDEFRGISAADGPYAQAQATARRLADMLRQRDRAWAEGPYLADWLLAHRWRGEQASRHVEHGVLQAALKDLIDGNRRLAVELDALQMPAGAGQLDAAHVDYESVRRAHLLLRTEFEEMCSFLDEQAAPDADTLRRLSLVLRSPLVPPLLRGTLLQKRVDCLFARAGRPEDIQSPPAAEETPQEQSAAAQLVADWPRHPMLDILECSDLPLLSDLRKPTEEESRPDDDVVWIARQGGVVRRRLADVLDLANSLEAIADARLAAAAAPLNARAGLSEADRLVRASAPLTAGRLWDDPSKDPVHRLRRVDRQFLLLWHCRRALDDFYAGDPGNAQRHYFAAVAGNYLQAARRLHAAPRLLAHAGEDLTALLKHRIHAAESVSIAANDLRVESVAQSVPQTLHVGLPDGMPRGETSVCMSLSDGSLLPFRIAGSDKTSRRILETIPPASTELDLKLEIPLDGVPQWKSSDRFAAVLRFRGHEFRSPFTLRGPRRVATTVVTAPPRLDTEVVVQGDSRQQAYVMFVLDCSGSMQGGRMETAKAALKEALALLKKQGNYNVGLRVFGRRAKWIAGQVEPAFASHVPESERIGLSPDRDTERLVELNVLDERQKEKIDRVLDSLEPFGPTPLYHALRTSLAGRDGDFVVAAPDQPRHIVVVTDGINEERDTYTLPGNVLDVRKRDNPKARISIILIDRREVEADRRVFSKPPTTPKGRVEALKDLATGTGGTFHDASDTGTLVKELRAALQLAKFSVGEAGTEPPQAVEQHEAAEQHDLGDTARIDVPGPPRKLEVAVHGVDRVAPVRLVAEGGERFILELDKQSDTHRLFFPRYNPRAFSPLDDARARPVQVTDLSSGLKLNVRPLLPSRRADDRGRCEFYVYIENVDDGSYTPRPKHFWAEIRPLTETGQTLDQVYHFYDVDLVARRPVPVLRFSVGDWPDAAKQAEIRLWFTTADAVRTGREIAVDAERVLPLSIAGLDAQFTVESQPLPDGRRGTRVIVNEQRRAGEAGQLCRVQVSPRPARIEHRLSEFPETELLRHVFDFDRSVRATVLITPRSSIVDAATEVPPLVVRVAD